MKNCGCTGKLEILVKILQDKSGKEDKKGHSTEIFVPVGKLAKNVGKTLLRLR